MSINCVCRCAVFLEGEGEIILFYLTSFAATEQSRSHYLIKWPSKIFWKLFRFTLDVFRCFFLDCVMHRNNHYYTHCTALDQVPNKEISNSVWLLFTSEHATDFIMKNHPPRGWPSSIYYISLINMHLKASCGWPWLVIIGGWSTRSFVVDVPHLAHG